MRILHVIPGLTRERGGPSEVVRALAQSQSMAGHHVTVLTTDQGIRAGEHPVHLPDSVIVERAKVWGPDRVAYAPAFTALVGRRLGECDIAHVHSVFTFPVHEALRVASANGTPVVVRPCGQLHPYSLKRSQWQKKTYLTMWGGRLRRACWAWHYTSENEAARSWPWDRSPSFVLPNGIEPDEYAVDRAACRAAVRSAWPRIDGPYVLFLGRLHPKKRLDLLIQAFLAGAPGNFALVVAGPDECGLWRHVCRQYLKRPADAARVHRVGMVRGPQKVALLATASLFALPSEHENFGLAALEALAAGTPVLLSPHVDLADAMLAADLGHTAPLETVAWRDRIEELLDGASSSEDFVERARNWVATHYAWSRIADELTERYQWVMNGCR